jgi:protein ImuA
MSRWESQESLQQLRAEVTRIERGMMAAPGEAVLPLGMEAIDRALGEGGLRRSALHEVSGSAADGFVAMMAGRLAREDGGLVLWCSAGHGDGGGLYPPGLAGLGLNPARLLMVRCRGRAELLAAAEEGLRGGGLAAVVVEADRVSDMVAGRRLQLAAEDGGVTGFLMLRRDASWRHGAKTSGAMAPYVMTPTPAVSRWLVDHAPGGGGLRWLLTLLRCRAGGAGAWMVDWNEKTNRLAVVPQTRD